MIGDASNRSNATKSDSTPGIPATGSLLLDPIALSAIATGAQSRKLAGVCGTEHAAGIPADSAPSSPPMSTTSTDTVSTMDMSALSPVPSGDLAAFEMDAQSAGLDPNANLIVNYIPNGLTDEQLGQIFSKYGTVESARIIKEKGTRKSLGYGFVRFRTASEAELAINGLNGAKLENKTLKVAVARPQGGEKNANVYVANLEPNVSSQGLQAMFAPYGTVTDAKVLIDRATSQSRCVGFVRFETGDEAEVAAARLNGSVLPGSSKPLVVRIAEKKEKKPVLALPTFARPASAVYGMSSVYGDAALAAYGYSAMNGSNLAAYSSLIAQQQQQVATQVPAQTVHNQHQALLPFATTGLPLYSSATVPFQMYNSAMSGLPPVRVSNTPPVCLFVYNLPSETDEGYLYQLFSPYGAIVNVKVMRDPVTNLCKGFGFVNMTKVDEAQAAISALNGAYIGHKMLQVSFKQGKGPSANGSHAALAGSTVNTEA